MNEDERAIRELVDTWMTASKAGDTETVLYLMTDDVEALIADLSGRGVACAPVQDQGWGLLTHVTLPGGGRLGVYEPRHARPAPHGAAAKKPAKRAARKPARKPAAKTPKKPARKPAKKAPRRRQPRR